MGAGEGKDFSRKGAKLAKRSQKFHADIHRGEIAGHDHKDFSRDWLDAELEEAGRDPRSNPLVPIYSLF